MNTTELVTVTWEDKISNPNYLWSEEELLQFKLEHSPEVVTDEEWEKDLLWGYDHEELERSYHRHIWPQSHWIPFQPVDFELWEGEDPQAVTLIPCREKLIVSHYPSPQTLENLLVRKL